ncbi:HDOD domain-containing protein [Hydrogenophaga soli]
MTPTLESPPDPSVASSSGDEADAATRRAQALARLMARISEHADFPTLRESIGAIQSIARSDRSHLDQLSNQVLSDVGMTSKLLRIINAAFYRSAGGGNITSMQRAVALMGFESVGMLAASLMLFERMPKGRDGEAARHECSRALLAGLLAQRLCRTQRHGESVYLAALFMNLGRMLVAKHFPEDARAIQSRVDEAVASLIRQAEANAALHTGAVKAPPQPPGAAQVHGIRERVSRQVLGLSHEDLGVEVARQWGWPDPLAQQLRRLYPDDLAAELRADEYLRVLCTAASDLSVELHHIPRTGDPELVAAARDACMAHFGATLGQVLKLDPESLQALGEEAMDHWADIAELLGIRPGVSPPAPAARAGSAAATTGGSANKPLRLPTGPQRIAKGLELTLQRLTDMASSSAPLDDVLRQVMTDLSDTLALQRMVVCLRPPGQDGLQGHLATGVRAAAVCAAFQVPLGGSPDLFSVLCLNAKDALISDTSDAVIAKRLPSWFGPKVGARTFVLLPLTQHARVHGLMYADRPTPGTLVLNESEMALLKSVRDGVLQALAHRGLTT